MFILNVHDNLFAVTFCFSLTVLESLAVLALWGQVGHLRMKVCLSVGIFNQRQRNVRECFQGDKEKAKGEARGTNIQPH